MRQLILAAIIIILIIGFIVWYIRQTLYSKVYQPRRTQASILDNPFEDCYLYANDRAGRWTVGKRPKHRDDLIHVWYLNRFKGKQVLLYFHGNSDDISRRFFMTEVCAILGVNLLLVEYRGFGKSTGSPGPLNVIEDANTAYNFLRRFHRPEDIKVWGESLGGTPALYVAGYRKVGGLVLLSTFSSLDGLLPEEYGVFNEFIKFACSDLMSKTRNRDMAQKVECDTLLIHSREDTLIPYWHAKDIMARLRGRRRLVTITGDHPTPNLTKEHVMILAQHIGTGQISNDQAERITDIIRRAMEARKQTSPSK